MKKLILLLMTMAITVSAYGKEASRKVASSNPELIEKGKTTLNLFMNCANLMKSNKGSKNDFLVCSYSYLSASLSEKKKNRYAAWTLMSLIPEGVTTCDNKNREIYLPENDYDLALCFDVNVEGLVKKGHVTLVLEEGALKIKELKY